MYDTTWAQGVLQKLEVSCARARNIQLCLQQLYSEKTGRICTLKAIRDELVSSLARKTNKTIWVDYKAVIKKTPLDKLRLEKLANKITVQLFDRYNQMEFNFNETT